MGTFQIDFGKSERVVGIDLGTTNGLVACTDLGHFPGFRELRCSEWGRLFSLRARFPAGPAGRNAGCGQEWPPHTNHEKALTGPKIIPGPDGGKLVPSIVSVSESGEIVVGSAAPERLVRAKPPQAFQNLVNEVVDSSRD